MYHIYVIVKESTLDHMQGEHRKRMLWISFEMEHLHKQTFNTRVQMVEGYKLLITHLLGLTAIYNYSASACLDLVMYVFCLQPVQVG